MMQGPAPRITATPVFRLLAEWRTGAIDAGWNATQPAGLAATSFLEGPSFDVDGNLWFVDIVNGRVLRMDPAGHVEVELAYDGWPNGLKIHADGRIFIADQKHGVMVYDREARRIAPFLEPHGADRFHGVNDLFFASNGDLYFTDQGLTGLHDPSGRLFRCKRDGALECLLDNVPGPNGLVMDLHEQSLFLAATRDNSIWRVPFDRAMRPVKVGRFIQLSGGIGPDGLALSEHGELLVAHAGLGCVWCFSPEGEVLERIDAPDGKLVTNLAFRPGTQDIYFTESSTGSIHRASIGRTGQPMFSHRPGLPPSRPDVPDIRPPEASASSPK
jgi:gluconolactonase